MKRNSLSWIVIGGLACGLGAIELAACSSSSGGTGFPAGGDDATTKGDSKASDDGATGSDAKKTDGGTTGDAAKECGSDSLHPRPVADGGDGGLIMNFLCPFSAPQGQKWKYCNSGDHCCVPYGTGQTSTCESACPDEADGGPFDGRDFECLDEVDCTVGGAGPVCCGTGQVLQDPACSTYYGKGFKGTSCKTSCDENNGEFIVCQKQDQCPNGKTCTAMSASGAEFGACL